jgi:hypothetical protein
MGHKKFQFILGWKPVQMVKLFTGISLILWSIDAVKFIRDMNLQMNQNSGKMRSSCFSAITLHAHKANEKDIPTGKLLKKTVDLLTPRNENFASHPKAYLKALLWALITGKLE